MPLGPRTCRGLLQRGLLLSVLTARCGACVGLHDCSKGGSLVNVVALALFVEPRPDFCAKISSDTGLGGSLAGTSQGVRRPFSSYATHAALALLRFKRRQCDCQLRRRRQGSVVAEKVLRLIPMTTSIAPATRRARKAFFLMRRHRSRHPQRAIRCYAVTPEKPRDNFDPSATFRESHAPGGSL